MASVFQLNQIPCQTLSLPPPNSQIASRSSILPSNSIGSVGKLSLKLGHSARTQQQLFRIQTVDRDDEWGEEKDETSGSGSAVSVAVEEAEPKELTEIDKLKKVLVDSFYGTDRGLRASSETKAEIVELITQLEPRPAEHH